VAPRNTYPSELADKFLLRLPDGMRERLATAAKKNRRSMNAEIVDRLLETLQALTPEERLAVERRAYFAAMEAQAKGEYEELRKRLDRLQSSMSEIAEKKSPPA
jgi:ubiquinone biosynthesis protein UbiJ